MKKYLHYITFIRPSNYTQRTIKSDTKTLKHSELEELLDELGLKEDKTWAISAHLVVTIS